MCVHVFPKGQHKKAISPRILTLENGDHFNLEVECRHTIYT